MSEIPVRKIVIDGKEYSSAEEMPPEIRAVYEKAMSMLADGDANGVPDLLEGKGPGLWTATKQVWGIAQAVRQAGIQSVELSPRPAGDPLAPVGEERGNRSSAPLEGPQPAGMGNFRKLVIAFVGATLFAIVLKQLGIIQ